MVAAAIIGGSLVGAVASNSSSRRAATATQNATDAASRQTQLAEDQYADWKKDFEPLQSRIVADANNVDSAQAYDKAAENANADVTQSFGRAKADLTTRLNSYGVDPSSGKYGTEFARMGLAEAAAGAGAQNTARQAVTDRGRAARMDAYSIGKGLPASAMAGLSSAANTNAMVAGIQSNNASRNAMGIGSIFQQAMPAISRWWNTPSTPGMGAYTPGGFTDSGWPEGGG